MEDKALKTTESGRRRLRILCWILLVLFALTGCAAEKNADTASAGGSITGFSDLEHARIGVTTGSVQAMQAEERFPEAELCYFTNEVDLLSALRADKIDAYASAEAMVRYMMAENRDLTCLDEWLGEGMQVGAIFPKTDAGRALCDEFNEFLLTIQENGVYDEIQSIWFGEDESKRVVPDLYELTGERGTLRMAADTSFVPFVYLKDGKPVGTDVDMVVRFCKAYGYGLEVVSMDFSGILPAVVTGKVDFACSGIAIRAERAESVLFSDPILESHSVVACLKSGSEETETPKTLADFAHAKIGVATGSIFPDIVHAALPDAELVYLNTTADMVNALKSRKIDAFAIDEPAGRSAQSEDPSMAVCPERLDSADYAFVMPKNAGGEALQTALNAYMQTLWDNGTMEALQAKWFDTPDLSKVESTEYRGLPATNGTIRLITTQYPPFIQSVEGFYSGYEIEILAMFARDCGYALEISEATFDGILASVQAGKADIGCTSVSVTEERKEVMLFSIPDYSGGTVLLTRREGAAENSGSFWESVSTSFEKTFIRENRWKLFLQGIGTTMLITVLSVLFGTALGFVAFMLCRNGNPAANAVTRFCVWLVRGTPVIVLLMILYYIIFGHVAISGPAVSIVGFTLVFGAGVYGSITAGVGAIDRGQLEAAYALGYTNRRAFYRVILPQAMPHFMPAYKASITEIIKATAVVGYVAVQDLTKMGDIVRSRTYDAFFPLIAVAVIYFILAAILTFIVDRIEVRIDPKRRSKESIRKEVEGK